MNPTRSTVATLFAMLAITAPALACGGPSGSWTLDLPSEAEIAALFAAVAWVPAAVVLGWLIPLLIERFGGPEGGARGARVMAVALLSAAAALSAILLPLLAPDSPVLWSDWIPRIAPWLLAVPFVLALVRVGLAVRDPELAPPTSFALPAATVLLANLALAAADLPVVGTVRQLALLGLVELGVLAAAAVVISVTYEQA